MSFDLDFVTWLRDRMEERDMKSRDLALAAKMDPGSLSRILNYERKPNADTLAAIADALSISRYEVFSAAGYMDNRSGINPIIESLAQRIADLPPQQQELINAMIDTLLAQQEAQGRKAAQA